MERQNPFSNIKVDLFEKKQFECENEKLKQENRKLKQLLQEKIKQVRTLEFLMENQTKEGSNEDGREGQEEDVNGQEEPEQDGLTPLNKEILSDMQKSIPIRITSKRLGKSELTIRVLRHRLKKRGYC